MPRMPRTSRCSAVCCQEGVNIMGTATLKTRVAGRPGYYGVKGIYGAREGADFSQLIPSAIHGVTITKQGTWFCGSDAVVQDYRRSAVHPTRVGRFPPCHIRGVRHLRSFLATPAVEALMQASTTPKQPLTKTLAWRIAAFVTALACATSVTGLAQPAPQAPPSTVLFQNVRIFDGKGGALSAPSNVLVRGHAIERISTAPLPVDRSANPQIVDGNGRTLMPGLIDAHAHLTFNTLPIAL